MAPSLLSYVPVLGRLAGPDPEQRQQRNGHAISLPPVQTHPVHTEPTRRASCLKHLLRANHVNHAILYHNLTFHNHASHLLCSAYLFGADESQLNVIYEKEARELEPWTPSPAEVTEDDWRDFLGDSRYQRAYVDFFDDVLGNWSFGSSDWSRRLDRFLFGGDQPLAHGLIGGLGHPLIQLGYAFEMNNQDIATEALGMAATQYNFLHKYLDDPAYSRPSPLPSSTSPCDLLDRLASDGRFDGLFAEPGFGNFNTIFEKHEDLLLEYWNAWDVVGSGNGLAQFQASQEAAVALLVGTVRPDSHGYNFFVVHLLTTSHAIRILLPLIPVAFHVALVREWWLLVLAVYVAELRPRIHPEYVDPAGRDSRKDWVYVDDRAINSEWAGDAHFVKALRAMKEAANTWGDQDERYLASAVLFANQFRGWRF